MKLPSLPVQNSSRELVEYFKGYNHNLRIANNEFFDMKNMTSDHYPVLSPRKRRGFYAKPASPQGIIAKEKLCYVDGTDFVIGSDRYNMQLSTAAEDCPKELVSMGAYVIILPDKKYINTANVDERGDIEAVYESEGDVTFTLTRVDGTAYDAQYTQKDAPENPENATLWVDTSTTPNTLKQWSESSGMWVTIATTYVKIQCPNIGKQFSINDGIIIGGLKDIEGQVSALEGAAIVWDRSDDYIVVVGILSEAKTVTSKVAIKRTMPKMDFIIEVNNRLWGCRYGIDDSGEMVNRLYASKLGDFKNWNCFMGLSTDSYYANVGSDGYFTGAIAHSGYALFFKENMLHKIYGNYPAEFTVQDTPCRGVQQGCHRSLAIVNETLFYKSRSGICAYEGALPIDAGYAMGTETYSDAVGGAHGNKYYVSMKHSSGEWNLFVFDVAKSMWHKEDNFHVSAFCTHKENMYAIDADNYNIISLFANDGSFEEKVEWMTQTGEIGIASPDMKYISRMTIRLSLERGSVVDIYAQYDFSDEWVHVCNIRGTSLRSYSVPIRPRRCDYMKLKFVGEGDAKIYSYTKTIEQGSEYS